MTRTFFVVNPVAGTSEAEEVKENIRRHCDEAGWNCEIHETSSGEEVGKVVRETQGEGFDLFVACGGDGTVSGVAGGLVHAEQPMGIVPTGTGNVFAQDLGIPRNIDEALALITGDHNIRPIDVMRTG
ncbi:MAG: diacylglycerol/lipid kinase family protein, partial [Anaerolineae bacterium]